MEEEDVGDEIGDIIVREKKGCNSIEQKRQQVLNFRL